MLNYLLVLLTLVFLSVTAFAKDVGFAAGTKYESVFIYGELTVHCHEGSQSDSMYAYCRQTILAPSEFTHFYGPEGVKADKVLLIAKHEDGSVKEKKKKYNYKKGRTKNEVNLWVTTLFQRALLENGRNDITYVMKNNGKNVASGEFVADVEIAPERRCRRRRIHSFRIEDCRGGSAKMCQKYFQLENYCRY